jgi:cytochrome c-type biogenesis protein CcmF
MKDYEVEYQGKFVEARSIKGYIPKDILMPTASPQFFLARDDFYRGGQKLFNQGDSVEVLAENTYYRVEYTRPDGGKFALYPRAQVNPQMGFIASPDIQRDLSGDLYTHVSAVPDDSQPVEWSEPEPVKIELGKEFFINDYVATVENLQQLTKVPGLDLQEGDIAVKAIIKVLGEKQEYVAEPIYVLRTSDKSQGSIAAVVNDLAVKIAFTGVHPDENSVSLTTSTTQKEYIVLKALEKPLINLLWLGVILMIVGFSVAIYRRWQDYKNLQQRQNA